jgi:hypothetical protein
LGIRYPCRACAFEVAPAIHVTDLLWKGIRPPAPVTKDSLADQPSESAWLGPDATEDARTLTHPMAE